MKQETPIDHIFNQPGMKRQRRELRTDGTAAEAVLWTALKAHRLDGWRWRRQYSIGCYIVDFYCPKAKLCVELDGQPHYTPEGNDYDRVRTEFFSRLGIRVLRFENRHIREMPEAVLDAIRKALNQSRTHIH